MKIVLLGAPGSGKGTQSPFIHERYGLTHLSTGDMLREAVSKGTPAGKSAKSAMDSGKLVSDEIVFDIIKERIAAPDCAGGYILDGFPRTVNQAKLIQDAGEKIDMAIEFVAPDEVILQRTSGRWIHKGSGRTYHEVFSPPKVPQRDDVTGEPLYQRDDDRREVCVKRLEVYKKETMPVVEFYKGNGAFASLDADRSINEVRESIVAILDPIANRSWFSGCTVI